MSSNILKLIACFTMLLDHIGYMMMASGVGDYNVALILRLVGRISFPIFAFLIAEGFKHTKNVVFYAARLFLAGIISEIPYNLCFHGKLVYRGSLNVMFTFTIALIMLIFSDMCIKSSKKEIRFLFILPLFSACYFAESFSVDYGYFAILLIFLLYIIDSNQVSKKILLLPVLLMFAARYIISAFIEGNTASLWHHQQLYATLAFVPLVLYNGKGGSSGKSKGARKLKQYLFYLFYPAHLLALYFVFKLLVNFR
ncbi:MAG: hypothetical protein IKJ91_06200 [Clostridia bacterium]|nr:hypothetical protein [Clostridia bacterium]